MTARGPQAASCDRRLPGAKRRSSSQRKVGSGAGAVWHHPTVRFVIAVAGLLLATGCSTPATPEEERDAASAAETSTAPEASKSDASKEDGPNPCELLTAVEMERLTGEPVGQGTGGMSGGLRGCQWSTPSGRGLQVIAVDASEWVRALPDLIAGAQASGAFDDSGNVRKLREAAELVESGEQLDEGEACSLFSEMMEMQGQPPGTNLTVNLLPTQVNPQAVSGQICAEGRYTSVMIADADGFGDKPPVVEVKRLISNAHGRYAT